MDRNEDNYDTIEFPRKISVENLKDLFVHIGRELPGTVEYYGKIRGSVGLGRFINKWENEEESTLIGGNIRTSKILEMISFNISHEVQLLENDECKICYNGIRFDTIPGYSKEE